MSPSVEIMNCEIKMKIVHLFLLILFVLHQTPFLGWSFQKKDAVACSCLRMQDCCQNLGNGQMGCTSMDDGAPAGVCLRASENHSKSESNVVMTVFEAYLPAAFCTQIPKTPKFMNFQDGCELYSDAEHPCQEKPPRMNEFSQNTFFFAGRLNSKLVLTRRS